MERMAAWWAEQLETAEPDTGGDSNQEQRGDGGGNWETDPTPLATMKADFIKMQDQLEAVKADVVDLQLQHKRDDEQFERQTKAKFAGDFRAQIAEVRDELNCVGAQREKLKEDGGPDVFNTDELRALLDGYVAKLKLSEVADEDLERRDWGAICTSLTAATADLKTGIAEMKVQTQAAKTSAPASPRTVILLEELRTYCARISRRIDPRDKSADAVRCRRAVAETVVWCESEPPNDLGAIRRRGDALTAMLSQSTLELDLYDSDDSCQDSCDESQ